MIGDGYEPCRKVRDIHGKHKNCFVGRSQRYLWDFYQLDLLYFYLGSLKGADQKRAKKTIFLLEYRVTHREEMPAGYRQ